MPFEFPTFKSLELADRDVIQPMFKAYRPETSELTFTNVFIWREHYRFRWSVCEESLVILGSSDEGDFFLPPVGPPSRMAVVRTLLAWLRDEMGGGRPRIEKADQRLVDEIRDGDGFAIEPIRDHFDYVYRREDLVRLAGRKYHSKRNHLNQVRRRHAFEYVPITQALCYDCLRLTKKGCDWRACKENPEIRAECDAVHEAVMHFDDLGLHGGAVIVDGAIKAFTVGERLNDDTEVIHVEKADPDTPQFYTVINQQFCEHALQGVAYVNREQDLGREGLRKAKLSYYPERLIEKYAIRLA